MVLQTVSGVQLWITASLSFGYLSSIPTAPQRFTRFTYYRGVRTRWH